MKPTPPAASSDLERARALSHALQAPDAAAVHVPRPSAPAFARLMPRAAPPLEEGARWPRIVAWAAELTAAQRALAVDRTGLLVASVHLDDEEALRIGGHVALAVDQTAVLGGVRSLQIDLDGKWSTVVPIGDGEQAVLLVLSEHARPLPPDLGETIRRALQ